MRYNYILIFLFSITSCFSNNRDYIPVIEKIALEKNSLYSLKGTMYLPVDHKPDKIIIGLTSVWENDPHPDFTPTRDTLSYMRKYIQRFTNNNIGVLLLSRKIDWKIYSAMPLSIKTLVSDTKKALKYLESEKKYQNIPIGIWGSSEAGCAAAIIASQRKDITFSMLTSTPGVSGYDEFDYDVEKRYRPWIIAAGFSDTFRDSVYIFNKERFVYNNQSQESMSAFYENFYKGFSTIGRQIISTYIEL